VRGREFRNLKTTAVPEEELAAPRTSSKAPHAFARIFDRAHVEPGRQEMYYDRFYGLDELIERIEAVTIDDCSKPPKEFFRTEQIAVTILATSPA